MDEKPKSAEWLSDELATLLQDFRAAKPQERSELARRYAVAITELEKVYAYVREYIVSYIET